MLIVMLDSQYEQVSNTAIPWVTTHTANITSIFHIKYYFLATIFCSRMSLNRTLMTLKLNTHSSELFTQPEKLQHNDNMSPHTLQASQAFGFESRSVD